MTDATRTPPAHGSLPPHVPGRWRYLLAILACVGGFAAMGAVLAVQLPRIADGLQQIVVPGSGEIELGTGTHTVYLELRSVVDGEVFVANEVSGLLVRVAGPDGTPLSLRPVSGSSSYTVAGRHGQANFDFDVATAGPHRVSADYRDGIEGPRIVVAVGQGFGSRLLLTILPALFFALGGIALAGWLAISTFLRRRRARREMTVAA